MYIRKTPDGSGRSTKNTKRDAGIKKILFIRTGPVRTGISVLWTDISVLSDGLALQSKRNRSFWWKKVLNHHSQPSLHSIVSLRPHFMKHLGPETQKASFPSWWHFTRQQEKLHLRTTKMHALSHTSSSDRVLIYCQNPRPSWYKYRHGSKGLIQEY